MSAVSCIYQIAERQLLILEAGQQRIVDVTPDEEMHVSVLWNAEDLKERETLQRCLDILRPALCA